MWRQAPCPALNATCKCNMKKKDIKVCIKINVKQLHEIVDSIQDIDPMTAQNFLSTPLLTKTDPAPQKPSQ